MAARTYKKYMKKKYNKDYTLLKLFIISFFGMLLVFTFIIKTFSPSVDVSIGDYKQEPQFETQENIEELKNTIDNRLTMIQKEDQGRIYNEENKENTDKKEETLKKLSTSVDEESSEIDETDSSISSAEPVYKVFIGTYTSAEQAKVAKDIIMESGSSLNPIVKCLGSNNYTLQVGIFKSKASADALLQVIQQSYLPGRIVQDY